MRDETTEPTPAEPRQSPHQELAASLSTPHNPVRAAMEAFFRMLTVGALSGFVAGAVASAVIIFANGLLESAGIAETNLFEGMSTGDVLVLLVQRGAFGTLPGMMYFGARPWMNDAGRLRGLAYGLVLLAVLGAVDLSADTADFQAGGSEGLKVLLFGGAFVILGLLIAPMFDWLSRSLAPMSRDSFKGLGTIVALLLSFMLVLEIVIPVAVGFQREGLLRLFLTAAPIHFIVVLTFAGTAFFNFVHPFDRISELLDRPRAALAAYALLAVPVVTGAGLTMWNVLQIMSQG
ncbi:MAG: hypothetical protein ACOC5K_01345 [Chloroflexota bacterium]